jgi:hypothetical protein
MGPRFFLFIFIFLYFTFLGPYKTCREWAQGPILGLWGLGISCRLGLEGFRLGPRLGLMGYQFKLHICACALWSLSRG